MSLVIQEHFPLKPLNTFGVAVRARWYTEAANEANVRAALHAAHALHAPLLVLGGGSNLLFTQDIFAFVVRITSQGRRQLSTTSEGVLVEAEAGEAWHSFVLWTLEQGWSGLENLSLIPGTVGAAPMQNIGAYGVELCDVLHSLTALDRHTGELHEFSCADCEFAYRDSRFKREAGRWVILRVRFLLQQNAALHLEYGPLRQRLAEMGVTQPTAQAVSQAVCAIRAEKLPNPQVLGNAGSFFKNPVVSKEQAAQIRAQWPDVVSYAVADGEKLAAGWLIERAGWKGFRAGDAGVHSQQALVLVNYGAATGGEILALAQRIQADIQARFGVWLEIEPNVC